MTAETDLEIPVLLARIAEALERMCPPASPAPNFETARMFRFETGTLGFSPAPDFDLPLDLLMGVEEQKRRLSENLRRFAHGLPFNHVLLWGARGTGKSSLAKAAFMQLARAQDHLKLV